MTDKAGSGESQAASDAGGRNTHQKSGQPAAGKVAPANGPASGSNPSGHAVEAHDSLAHNLRKVYQSTVDEPVPDTIADLLSRLS